MNCPECGVGLNPINLEKHRRKVHAVQIDHRESQPISSEIIERIKKGSLTQVNKINETFRVSK